MCAVSEPGSRCDPHKAHRRPCVGSSYGCEPRAGGTLDMAYWERHTQCGSRVRWRLDQWSHSLFRRESETLRKASLESPATYPLLTTSRQSDRCYSITLPSPFTASRLTYFGEGPLLLPLKKCDCSGIALVKFEGENCLF